jgi:hypothetical protein
LGLPAATAGAGPGFMELAGSAGKQFPFPGAIKKLVDVGTGIKKLVRNQQCRHQDQSLVAQGAMLLHQAVEFRFEIVSDLFEPMNFALAASEAVGAIVEAYRYLSQPTWRRRRPPAQTRTSFILGAVMKRIDSPCNPVQGIGCALLEFGNSLLGDRQLGTKPRVLGPDVAVGCRLARRLNVFSPLDL